jgi:hypothetical protein
MILLYTHSHSMRGTFWSDYKKLYIGKEWNFITQRVKGRIVLKISGSHVSKIWNTNILPLSRCNKEQYISSGQNLFNSDNSTESMS